jgi:paraquat-inducible protein B
MSKPVNPMTIGGFLLGGLALLVVGLLVFGGGEVLRKTQQYVIYFDSSLNGLNVGAPVKLQGVQIGKVTSIALQLDRKTNRILKPVVIEVDLSSMVDLQGQRLKQLDDQGENRNTSQKLIDAGLRTRLEMQSLLTGLLYVDADFYPGKPVQLTTGDYQGIPELPSIPTTTEELKNTLDEVVALVRKLPLQQIADDLAGTLRETRALVASDETRRALVSLNKTFAEAATLAGTLNRQTEPLLRETQVAVRSSQSVAAETRALIQEFKNSSQPLLRSADHATREAASALKESRNTLIAVESAAGPDGPLQQSLLELRNAARSIRELADQLERHPDSIVFGKP